MSSIENQVYRRKDTSGPTAVLPHKETVGSPGAHEVLVKIHAVSLNYRDLIITTGNYPFPVKESNIPCSDVAGEVVAVGEGVTRFKKGDRVTSNFDPTHLFGPQMNWRGGLGGPIDGVLAQYRILLEQGLIHVAAHLSYEEAACLPCAGLTAWNALFGNIPLTPGQTVLLQGTGGVSISGLQYAVASGCKTIITSSSNEKLEVAKKLGATHVINYAETPNWDEEVKKLTNGVGVDYILEVGGATTIERSMNCIAPGGQIGCIGFLGGVKVEKMPDVFILALSTNAIVRGVQIGSRQQYEALMQFVTVNKIKPVVDKVFSFSPEDVIAAYKYMESQKHIGKIVIKVA